jgi:hypothetical protein
VAQGHVLGVLGVALEQVAGGLLAVLAAAYIIRQAFKFGLAYRMPKPNAVPKNAPTAWNAKALSTSRPRIEVAMLSEITMCAVG